MRTLWLLALAGAGAAAQNAPPGPTDAPLPATRLRAFAAPADRLAFTPDGKGLLLLRHDARRRFDFRGFLSLWNVGGGKVRDFGAAGLVESFAVSRDGRLLATAGDRTFLLDLASGRRRTALPAPRRGAEPGGVAFSPDNRLLAAGIGDRIKVWSLPRRAWVRTFSPAPPARDGTEIRYNYLHGPTFSPDGRRLYFARTIGFDGEPGGSLTTLYAADVSTGRIAWERRVGGLFAGVVFAPTDNGKAVAAFSIDAAGDWSAEILDAATGASRRLPNTARVAHSPALHLDGRRLAVQRSNRLRVWDLADGTEREYAVGGNSVRALAVSPDGGTLALAHHGGTVTLWRLGGTPPDTTQ